MITPIIEKGCLYKVKEYYGTPYTIFCPKLSRNISKYNIYRFIPCMFTVVGRGKSSKLKIGKGVENEVRVVSDFYVDKLTSNDYIKLSRLLKKEGYVFDKKTRKLIKLKSC